MRDFLRKMKKSLSALGNSPQKPEGVAAESAVRFLRHTIPGVMQPGQAVQAQIRLQNTGRNPWFCDSALVTCVQMVLRWNGVPFRTLPLPQAKILPEAVVDVPVDFLAPEQLGTQILSVDLVQQTIAFFEDLGSAPLHLQVGVQQTLGEESGPAAELSPRYAASFLEHNLPDVAPAGTRLGAWITVRNTGSLMWQAASIDPSHPVDLLVEIDGRLASTVPLPVSQVRAGECVTVFFTAPLPEEAGKHRLEFSLVRQNDCFFAVHGVVPLGFEIETHQEAATVSAAYFAKAMQLNSWFYMPSHGVVSNEAGSSFPVFARKAKGYTLWDTEGNRYIDYTSGWGCNLLGYAEERVNAAVRLALEDAATLPLPHPLLVEVSEMLCASIPSAEMTAFGKNGSDVCSLAVRLARVSTGRRKILVCGYHGFQDWYAELAGFAHSGVPERETALVFRFRFNDLQSFRHLLNLHGADLAAVMLEPSGPGEDSQGPSKEADVAFLRAVAAETRQLGAVLIFDEIITGFRYLAGSAQKQTGIIPDLTCLGKALGNGMPIAALVGRRQIMMTHMPRAFYGPTFKDEILSLAAAKACLEIYRSEPVSSHVWSYGARMIRDTNSLCQSLDIPAAMLGPAFRFSFQFSEPDAYRLIQLRTIYQQELMKRGILTYNGIMLPNYSHNEMAYGETMDAMQGALEAVRQAMRDGRLHRFIEIPLISC